MTKVSITDIIIIRTVENVGVAFGTDMSDNADILQCIIGCFVQWADTEFIRIGHVGENGSSEDVD